MNGPVISQASFLARDGAAEQLAEQLGQLLACARYDSGCLACELLCEAQPQGARWLLRGQWCSEEALQRHLRLPQLQVLGSLMGSGLVQHMELQVGPAASGV